MPATILEERLGDLPWLVVTGDRASAFTALGSYTAERIRAVVNEGTTMRQLNTRIATEHKTLDRYRTVHERSR